MIEGVSADRTRLAWITIGLVLLGAVLFVLHSFIGTFVFGIFLYYATRPVYEQLQRKIASPTLAAAVALVVLALPVLVLLTYTLAIGIQELDAVARTVDLGEYEQYIGPYANVSGVVENPGDILSQPGLMGVLQTVLDRGLSYFGFIGNGALHVFIMIALAYYLLRDGHRLGRWTRQRFGDDRGILDDFLSAVDRDFQSIFFGNLLNAIITAVIGALVYSLLDVFAPAGTGIPYAALVGLLTGAGSLVPVVGMKIVYVPVAAYLFFDALQADGTGLLWFPVAFVALSFVVVDVIPDLVLRPYVSGRDIHVGAIMLAYILGPLLFGWYGLFLGPIVLVLVVNFVRNVLPRLQSVEEVHPFAVDPTYLTVDPEPETVLEDDPVDEPDADVPQ